MSTNIKSSLGGEIFRLRKLLMAVPKGMGLAQLTSLTVVADEPGLSVNDLAERLGVPQQNASRYAAQLLGRYQDDVASEPIAFIEQRVNNSDPRKRALYPSPEGRDLLQGLLLAAGQNERKENAS